MVLPVSVRRHLSRRSLPIHLVEEHVALVTLISNAEEDEELHCEYAHIKHKRSHDRL